VNGLVRVGLLPLLLLVPAAALAACSGGDASGLIGAGAPTTDEAGAGEAADGGTAPAADAAVGVTPDATIGIDAHDERDASKGADSRAPGDGGTDAPVGCPSGKKPCGGGCVSLDDPAYGCGPATCVPCNVLHATATCAGGSCGVGACASGRGDCDQNPANGCEADLSTSRDHCGTCPNACDTSEVCSLGTCASTCVPPKAPCAGGCVDVTSDAAHCGACSNPACPGFGAAGDVVACAQSACSFACSGESYDVNGVKSDGCEVADQPTANHSQSQAVPVGSYSCDDVVSQQHITGWIPSDARPHVSPAIDGFDAASGSAPDWFAIQATSGFCINDLALELAVAGSANPSCYHLRAITSVSTYECQTGPAGTCSFVEGVSSYGDNTTIYVEVSKTCPTSAGENPSYAITGHL
jgi:hypothetical protein